MNCCHRDLYTDTDRHTHTHTHLCRSVRKMLCYWSYINGWRVVRSREMLCKELGKDKG